MGIEAFNGGACRVEARVDENRADHGFQRIGQDRRPCRSTATQFALAQPHGLPQIESMREAMQCVLVDEARAQP